VELVLLIILFTINNMDRNGRRDLFNLLKTSTQLRAICLNHPTEIWVFLTLSIHDIDELDIDETGRSLFFENWVANSKTPVYLSIKAVSPKSHRYPLSRRSSAEYEEWQGTVNRAAIALAKLMEQLKQARQLSSFAIADSECHSFSQRFFRYGLLPEWHWGRRTTGARFTLLEAVCIAITLPVWLATFHRQALWQKLKRLKILNVRIDPYDGTGTPDICQRTRIIGGLEFYQPIELPHVTHLTITLNRRELYFLSYLACPALKHLTISCNRHRVLNLMEELPFGRCSNLSTDPKVARQAYFRFIKSVQRREPVRQIFKGNDRIWVWEIVKGLLQGTTAHP